MILLLILLLIPIRKKSQTLKRYYPISPDYIPGNVKQTDRQTKQRRGNYSSDLTPKEGNIEVDHTDSSKIHQPQPQPELPTKFYIRTLVGNIFQLMLRKL